MTEEPERDSRGRFSSGHHSPDTEFKEGVLWYPPKPYWNKDWLESELKNKSVVRIAAEQGVHYNTIHHFIRKHELGEK